jgi:hypothetical protein
VSGEWNDGAWIIERRYCHACAALAAEQRAIQDEMRHNPSVADGLLLVPVYRPDLAPGGGDPGWLTRTGP